MNLPETRHRRKQSSRLRDGSRPTPTVPSSTRVRRPARRDRALGRLMRSSRPSLRSGAGSMPACRRSSCRHSQGVGTSLTMAVGIWERSASRKPGLGIGRRSRTDRGRRPLQSRRGPSWVLVVVLHGPALAPPKAPRPRRRAGPALPVRHPVTARVPLTASRQHRRRSPAWHRAARKSIRSLKKKKAPTGRAGALTSEARVR